jgi:cytosine/adenosine deaminase-related metal-dependent hydrolase
MKNNSRNAAKLDATKLLKIATINGAISLGLSERVGQICSGFEADFFGVDLDTLLLKNIQADELADALIFGCGNSEIKRVIVAGVQH